jgi:hypothetical protein
MRLQINPKLATSVASLFFMSASGVAQSVGAPELRLVEEFLTGNYGFLIGLATAFAGVYKLAAKADPKGGALLIILGVLFTMIPAIYNGTRLIVCPIARALAPNAICSDTE